MATFSNHCLRRMAEAVAEYEKHDTVFKAVTAEYRDKRALLHHWTEHEAIVAARKDPRRIDAGSARVHFSSEATMYALAAIADMMKGQDDV